MSVRRANLRVLGLMLAGACAAAAGDEPKDGLTAVRQSCSGCHPETAPGHFERISAIRETPEGWVMTMFRMRQVHGLSISSKTKDLVLRYLTDAGGLAPSEAAAGRFALERRPNMQDVNLGEDLRVMCGRCHSMARTTLQRRDAPEWLKLVHMHVGQWPTLEYQESGRNRYWWQTATTEVPQKLAALYPHDTPAWRAWKARKHASLVGRWIVYGHTPGRGDYFGTAVIERRAPEEYTTTYTLRYTDGKKLDGSSVAVVYTGYEWRGTATLGGQAVREVYAASEDGAQLAGRWFESEHSEHGGDWTAVRADGAPAVLAVYPRALRRGASGEVVVIGRGLTGAASFGPGTHVEVLSSEPGMMRLRVAVDPAAPLGYRDVAVGGGRGKALAAVYDRVARVEVAPHYGIARLGGGKLSAVDAQFEAQGYIDIPGEGGKPTAVSLGALPASWHVEPFNEQAAHAQDVRFAGQLDPTGRFLPAGAGPNPAREFSGNNVGDLAVVASVQDGSGQELSGKAHLVVTVQRWNTPPIY